MKNNFYIRQITPSNAKEAIEETGFDKSYIAKASHKYDFRLIKIHNLTPPQGTIIKQLALSVGADAALHREVITCKVDKTDLLLGCTAAQLNLICEKLKKQPFSLPELADLLIGQIKPGMPKPLKIRNKVFEWGKKTYLMGILNVTPDSFSDGGKFFSIEDSIKQAKKMIEEGADIIDIGGESTRPGAKEVSPDEEIARVVPVIEKLREFNQEIPVSIDTRHSTTAKAAIDAGAEIINDVSGLEFDPGMRGLAADLGVPVIIMHSQGLPETMQKNIEYKENIIDSIFKSLYDRTQLAIEAGINPENIIIDPGIGFGKTIGHNFEIVKRIQEFKSPGFPVLAGASRKSFIWKTLECSPDETEEANIAVNSYLAAHGADILRVHDVKKHYNALRILENICW